LTSVVQGLSDYPRKEHVAILTAASLSRNPRVLREAEAVARAGFEVVVYGAAIHAAQGQIDEALANLHGFAFKSVLPVGEGGFKSRLLSIWRRIRTRIGADSYRYLHIENTWQLGPAVVELAKQARKVRADFCIAHLEQAMWVCAQLECSKSRIGIDMEDWYSEDLLPDARKFRPLRLLRELERKLLTTSAHSTCPSRAMSDALAEEFGCPPPTVVYNALPWADRTSIDGVSRDRRDRSLPSIHWFSQTLGHGRGLEDLVAALPLLNHEAEIHLRGNPVSGFEDWLAHRVPGAWRGRIVVHGVVPSTELLSRIAEHDIGFAGETPLIRSRDLTVTNKILYYLLAGLAVVASDTSGQREVAAQAPGGVILYPSGDASALAACLDALLVSAEALGRAKSAALDAARQTFCWERQEKLLMESIEHALRSPVI
jgi:glycosyltransferase involved in cell wall biosynthesis